MNEVADAGGDPGDLAWHRRGDVIRVVGLRFRMALPNDLDRSIQHSRVARLAVQLEKDRARPIVADVARRQIANDQRLALLYFHRYFLAGLQAVEEVDGGYRGGVAVLGPMGQVFPVHLWVED